MKLPVVKIICGRDDIAGRHICEILEKNFSVPFTALDKHPIYHDYPEKEINAGRGELIVIPSQHKSLKEVRSLTVHAAGNFGTNDLGGLRWKMCPYDARFARGVLLNLHKYGKDLGYEITYEATHHGPYSENPIVFVEIGSTEKEYRDREASYVVARSIYEAYDEEADIYCGIGGLHYSSKFTKQALFGGIAIGHIASKHRFQEISGDVLREMMDKSPGARGFLIEEKSFSSEQRKSLVGLMKSQGYEYLLI